MNKSIRRIQQTGNSLSSAASTAVKRIRKRGDGDSSKRYLQAEKALRESEEKYRSLFQYAKDAIILADAKTGILLDVNTAGCTLLGLPKGKIVGKHQSELHPPELADKYIQLFQEHVQKGTVINEDIVIQRADGTRVPVDISASVIKLADKTIIQGIFRDISDRLRMARALAESEEKISKAFRAIPESVSIATLKSGVFLEVNDSFLSLNGYTREEVIGHTGKELNIWVNPDDQNRMKQLIEKRRRFENEEFVLRKKSGKTRTVVMSADVINFNGQPCMLTVSTDITERKRIEEALRQSEAKYASLVERSNDGIIILEAGVLKFVNNKMAEMTGFTREEAIGRKFIDFTPPEEKQKLMEIHLKRVSGIDVPTKYETTIVAQDGHRILTEVNAGLITYEGRPAVMAIVRDITGRKRAEQTLIDEATRRRILIEQSRDGIVILDQDGKVFETNQKFADMLGYTHEEVRHLNVVDWEFLYPPDKVIEMIRTVDEKGDHFETQHRRKDGSIYNVEISTNGAIFAGQKLVFCVCRDITERKKMEQALRESEDKFSRAFHAIPEAVSISRFKDGVFIDVNDNYCLHNGLNRDEVIGRTAVELGLWDQFGKHDLILEGLQDKDNIENMEVEIKTPTGEMHYVLLSAEKFNIGGEPHVLTLGNDITERKQMEQAMQESEEKFAAAFRSSPDMIAIIRERDGICLEVNDSFTRVTGYSREELVGHPADEYNMFVSSEDLQKAVQLRQEQGRQHNEEISFIMKSGEIRQWLCSSESINIGGEPCVMSVATDITERKQMEQAIRESEEKFSKAFHSSPQQIIITRERDDVTLEVNDSFMRATGYTREETIGKTSKELGVWPKSEDNLRLQQMLKKNGRIANEEFEFINKSGEKTTTLVHVEPITIGGEKCWMSIVTDITERKQMEQAVRESEEKFSKAFHTMPVAVSIARVKDRVFLDVNESFCIYNGFTREEIVGKNSQELGVWQRREDRLRLEQQLEDNGRLASEEFEFLTKSGEKHTELLSIEPITISGEKCWLSISIDVTKAKETENALKESEAKFSKAFRAMPESVSISKLDDGTFIDVNESFCRDIGKTRDEIIGHTGDWVEPEQRKRIIQMIKEKGRAENVECEFRKKSGELHTLLISADIINVGGEPCLLSIGSDITERKRMEETIRESEEKYRNIVELAQDGIASVDLQGQITTCNEAFGRLVGTSAKDIIGKKFTDVQFINAEDMPMYVDTFKSALAGKDIPPIESKWNHPDGTTRTIELRISLMKDKDKVIGIHALILDITERKRMEQALRESEEKFSKAFQAMPEGVAISRVKDGVFIDVNDSFCRDNECTREEVIGRSGTEIINWVNPARRKQIMKTVNEQGHIENVECEFKKKSGEIHTALFSAETINISGEPCILCITNDITELKAAEKNLHRAMLDLEQSSAMLKATNKELESFSYSVSHDLRSPLRSIDGFSQALIEDYSAKLDEKGQDYLNRLRGASQKMGELIDGLLKLSRLTRSEMHNEKVDLTSLANEIATRLQENDDKRNVKFDIGNDLSATGDPQMLRVLLENLLGNAWKFTKNTQQARIEFGSTTEDKIKTFYIKDNGAGFDMAFKEKLFGAFQRLHDVADYPGTGIGLATVQRIINRHGGIIRAEGKVGEGATFYFTLN